MISTRSHSSRQYSSVSIGVEGLENSAGLFAQILDLREVAVQMGAGFHLNGNDVSAGFGEVGNVLFRLDDHQVNIQRLLRHRTERLDDQWADGDVGHEAAVHDVDMDPVSAGLIHGFHLVAETCEIGRQMDGEITRGLVLID